ncbi:MAG: GldG family protein [Bacteroides sp.]|nr:GldG family protein [Bacteroides sp.]
MSKKDMDINKEASTAEEEKDIPREESSPEPTAPEKAEKVGENGVSENKKEASPEKPAKKKPSGGKGKRLKHGALSVVFTVIFVTAVVLVNIIFSMVLDRFDISADLTDNSMYSIDGTTADYVAGIESNVTITVTAEEADFENAGAYYKQVSEIVKTFAASSSKITARYLDLDSNPAFYSNYGATLSAGSIIVESEKTGRNTIVAPSDYLSPKYSFNGNEITAEDYSMYYQLGYGSMGLLTIEYYAAAERCLLSGIMNVTDERPVRVAVLTEDYGASSPSALVNMLEANAYVVEEMKISSVQTIDSDIDFVILFAPIYDLSNDDLNKIDMWLDNGGRYDKNLFYAAASTVDELPNLNAYLREWGISLGTGYVFQTNDYAYNGANTYQTLSLAEGVYSEGVDSITKQTQGDRLKPIELLFDEYSIYETEAIVSSFGGSVIAPFDGLDDFNPASAEQSGSFPVVASSTKTYYEGVEPHQSRIYVASGHYITDRIFMEAVYLNNSDIFLNIFNYASGKDKVEISVSPKSFSVPTFEITASQMQAITVVFAVVVPLAVTAAGIAVIVRRKRR